MSVFKRADISASWNSGTSWTLVSGSGTYPSSAADQAIWDSTVTLQRNISAIAVTIGQVAFQNPATNQGIIAGTGTITLSPSAFSNVGIDMSSGTTTATNLSISAPLALGSSQTWSVASGRTLTVSGAITGAAKDLTVTGAGTTSIGATGNATSWTGSIIRVSGGLLAFTDTRALGAATNSVVVDSGGAVRIDGTAGLGPSLFTVSGSGASGLLAGAIYFSSPVTFAAGKTIALSGASPTILLGPTAAGGLIQGTPTSGDITFNITGTSSSGATLTNAQTFTVPSGAYLVLQGANSVTGAAIQADFGLATSDANPFGAAGNEVKVRSSLRLTNSGAGAGTLAIDLSRNYFFDGESAPGTPASPNTYSIAPAGSAGSSFTFTGTVNGTPTNWVKTNVNGGTGSTVQFGSVSGGKLNGTWNLRSFASTQTIYLHPNLDISTWTGALYTYRVSYGVAPTGAATYESGAVIDNISGSTLTLAHSGYSLVGSLTFTGTSSMSLGGGNVTASASPTLTVSASTLTISGNIGSPATLVKNGAGTLALSGNNTIPTGVTLSAGTLALNSAGSAGPSAATFTFVVGAALDSTTGATLNQNGLINTGAAAGSWTWVGTNDLTFGTGNITLGGDRTITHGATGGLGTLKFSGAITTGTLTTSWDFGGSTAGAKQRVTLGGANASLADATAANQHAITAGYFRIENNNGLGAVATTTTWWVGATNLGVPTTKAALELAGVTTPDTKSVKLYSTGPNDDGALIGASGTSVFSGNIEVPNLLLGARIGVKTGATLTLLGSGIYPNLNPANAGTPLSFTAESGGTLNVNRVLGGSGTSNAGTVTVANGDGTVVFSRANLHTGAMTCSSGTTKLTQTNAAGAGAGNSVTVSAGATMEVTVKAVFPATLTLGNSPTIPAIFKVSV
jgi:autotransporter-associated beta strand protein